MRIELSSAEMYGALKLREHLLTAEKRGYPVDKMHYVDGFLAALNTVTGREFSFSGSRVFLTVNGHRELVLG